MSNTRPDKKTAVDYIVKVGITSEFQQRLKKIESGELTKQSILNGNDCQQAVLNTMAFNLLASGSNKKNPSEPQDFIDYRDLEPCKRFKF